MTVMKLSDALRLADEMGLPDLRFDWIEADTTKWEGEKPPSCAITGAHIAAHNIAVHLRAGSRYAWVEGKCALESLDGFLDSEDIQRFGRLLWCPQPLCDIKESDTAELIIHLYDHHEWSRTKIASWLDRISKKSAAQAGA